MISTLNTYAWIRATAISSRLRAIWALDRRGVNSRGVRGVAELSKTISRCPAIMFADSRIASVAGRMRFLTVSIITMKGIRGGGVPCGIRWASRFEVLFIHPNRIIANQAGRASDRVKARCLEEVNT